MGIAKRQRTTRYERTAAALTGLRTGLQNAAVQYPTMKETLVVPLPPMLRVAIRRAPSIW
jgi:hypothetical protein